MRREIELLLLVTVLLAAFFDLRQRRVPNWLTLSAAICGFILNVWFCRLPGLWCSLEGLGIALAIYLPLYLLRGVGGGDVKLMAAIGAIAGPIYWIAIIVLTAVTGAIAGMALVLAKSRMIQTFLNIGSILKSLLRGRAPHREHPELDVANPAATGLPHGAVIAGATLFFLAFLTLGYIKL